MLGDKIYSLRKNRKISQEEFAEILNVSRQAVSKWERNESKPDIDKLIVIAKLFNVSIDYLLSHELNYSNIDSFLNELKECYSSNNFTISINDIRIWCSKYTNNFKLHVYSADYLYIAFIVNNNDEYLDLALYCINKAISIFTPEENEIITLNDLHLCVAQIYMLQQKYELAKEYINNNNIYGCELLHAKCNFLLKNFDDALNESSEIYINSTSNIINVSYIQIMILLKNKKIQDAFDLVNWTISFINSIKNNDDYFVGILFPFIYLKATCEQLLNINNEDSIKILKDMSDNTINLYVTSDSKSIKYYFGKSQHLSLIDSNIKNILKEIIKHTSKDDIHYQPLINIFSKIIGEKYYE